MERKRSWPAVFYLVIISGISQPLALVIVVVSYVGSDGDGYYIFIYIYIYSKWVGQAECGMRTRHA